jgi:hypothetical protein
MDFDASYVFVGFLVLVVGMFLLKIIKHSGFKGALFGASIGRTLGEVSSGGGKLGKTLIKIHTLQGDSDDKAVGVEFVAKSFASYQMMPCSLSVAETRKLISLLESAVRGR